jgi:hypothetical protein
MHPTEVKTTFAQNSNTEEQTTTGLLGSIWYKIIKRTDYGAPDRNGGRSFKINYSIYIQNDLRQWVPASEVRSREALISFGFIRED